jgi:hypothetical protein
MEPGKHRAHRHGLDGEDRLPSIDELLGPEIGQADVSEQARELLGIGPERAATGSPTPASLNCERILDSDGHPEEDRGPAAAATARACARTTTGQGWPARLPHLRDG